MPLAVINFKKKRKLSTFKGIEILDEYKLHTNNLTEESLINEGIVVKETIIDNIYPCFFYNAEKIFENIKI